MMAVPICILTNSVGSFPFLQHLPFVDSLMMSTGICLLHGVSSDLALFLNSPRRPLKSSYFFELGKWHLTPNNVFVTESL